MGYKRKGITLINQEVLINGKVRERPYWAMTNWGRNPLGLGIHTSSGGETVGGNVSVYVYDVD